MLASYFLTRTPYIVRRSGYPLFVPPEPRGLFEEPPLHIEGALKSVSFAEALACVMTRRDPFSSVWSMQTWIRESTAVHTSFLKAFSAHFPSRACMVMPSRRAASISRIPFLLSLTEVLENGHAVTEYEHFL
jgi:hypothetical protein